MSQSAKPIASTLRDEVATSWTARHLLAIVAICALTSAAAYAQFGRGGFFGFGAGRIATAQDFDGRFHYCRIVYRQSPTAGTEAGARTTLAPTSTSRSGSPS